MIVDTTRITDPYIYVWDKEIPEETCEKIITKFEKNIDESVQGIIGSGVDLNVKNSRDICISDRLATWEEEDKLFYGVINDAGASYFQHLNQSSNYTYFTTDEKHIFKPITEEIIDSGYQIQKTDPGKGYIWHHDFTYHNDLIRTLTFILYLNTVEEGWTQFYNGDQISPRAGRVAIFPATWTYLHQGYPPKQTKYLMTGWLHASGAHW